MKEKSFLFSFFDVYSSGIEFINVKHCYYIIITKNKNKKLHPPKKSSHKFEIYDLRRLVSKNEKRNFFLLIKNLSQHLYFMNNNKQNFFVKKVCLFVF